MALDLANGHLKSQDSIVKGVPLSCATDANGQKPRLMPAVQTPPTEQVRGQFVSSSREVWGRLGAV